VKNDNTLQRMPIDGSPPKLLVRVLLFLEWNRAEKDSFEWHSFGNMPASVHRISERRIFGDVQTGTKAR